MKGVPTTAAMLMLAVTIFGVAQGLPLAAPSPEDAHPVIPLGQGLANPETLADTATLINADESKDPKKLDEGVVDVTQKATYSAEKIPEIAVASPEEIPKERTIGSDPIAQAEAEPKIEDQPQARKDENKVSDDIIIPAAAEISQPEEPKEIIAVKAVTLIKEEPAIIARSEESVNVKEKEPAPLNAEEEKLKIDEVKDAKAIAEVAHEVEQTEKEALKERTIIADVVPEQAEHHSANIQEPVSVAEHINRDGKLSEESKEPKELEEVAVISSQTEAKIADEKAAPASKENESKPEDISLKVIQFSETKEHAETAPIASSKIEESKVAGQENPVAGLASETAERSRTVSESGVEAKADETIEELSATKGEEIVKETVLPAEAIEKKEKEEEIKKEEEKLIKEEIAEVAKDPIVHETLPEAVKLEGEKPIVAPETSQESSEESSEEEKSNADKTGVTKSEEDWSQEESQEKSEQGSKKIS